MRQKWIRKKIDTNNLCERIEKFLESAGFKLLKNSFNDEVYEFIGIDNQRHKVKVTIKKGPDGLSVEFLNPYESDPLFKFSNISSFFGLGFLIKSRACSYDFYRKLEDKFWDFIEQLLS